MAIREALQKNRLMGLGIAAVLFAFAGWMIAYTFWPSGPRVHTTGAFYTDDDGRSFYYDSIFHFPPYDHDGKTAVAASVYSGNSGKFVGFMARYTPEAKKLLEDEYAKAQSGQEPMYQVLHLMSSPRIGDGIEYKLPGGDQRWSRARPFVKAPDGGDCIMVMP